MQPILLEATFPAASWLGVLTTVALGFLSWLLKENYAELKEKIKKQEEKLALIDKRQDSYERETNDRIYNLHLTILQKLEEIKDKYNKFRA